MAALPTSLLTLFSVFEIRRDWYLQRFLGPWKLGWNSKQALYERPMSKGAVLPFGFCSILLLWKHLLILVTAFTVGHSVTLALASVGSLAIPSEIIEFLIPTTILLTALHNVISRPPAGRSRPSPRSAACRGDGCSKGSERP